MPRVVLFVGPSAFGVDLPSVAREHHVDLDIRPPVRRGDIDSLLKRRPAVAIVCDGLFQSTPAVGHAELCRATAAGWSVWGVSSLGAIRAHELRDEGMRGYGYVHRQFARVRDFRDDEVALLHFPEAPYFPLSEPLVNLRYALEQRANVIGMTASARAAVIRGLQRQWFGDRTQGAIHRALVRDGHLSSRAATGLLEWMAANRIKTLDLLDLLRVRPWSDPARTASTDRAPAGPMLPTASWPPPR